MWVVIVVSGLVVFLAGFVVHRSRKARERALALAYLELVPTTGFIDLYELREAVGQKEKRLVPYGEALQVMELLASADLVESRDVRFVRKIDLKLLGARVPKYCLTPAGLQRQRQMVKAACA